MKKVHVGAIVRPVGAVVFAAASAAAFAGGSNAATGANGAMTFAHVKVVSAPAAGSADAAAGAAGMRVQKDKDTGQLRAPTAAEVAELDAGKRRTVSTPVQLRTLKNGIQSAVLNEDFMSYEVVHKGADGAIHSSCVTGETAAEHAMHANIAAQEVQHDR